MLTLLPFLIYLKLHSSAQLRDNAWLLAAQGVAQLLGFGLLTWAIGHRRLKLSWPQLGWWPTGRLRGFGLGLEGAAILATASLLISVGLGDARWLSDSGTVTDYLQNVGLTTVTLAPAALAEELMFRGLPLVILAAVLGRGTAILVMALIFGLAHAWNPDVTPLAIGNIALAGVFLSLAFYAPGGIWTAWGAHLGWNATLAALDAPVSGLPFRIPLIDFSPGTMTWLSGGKFGPEGGIAATLVLSAGCIALARYVRKEEIA
jgi:uncharacterized protein